jgi:predicted DNA-binding antitoxin AbrB/MazE fold protein
MDKTIRARFLNGVIEPLEKVTFSEGEEFTVIVPELPEKPKKKELKIPIHLVKADVFLKHAGLISVGGDAVEESDHYDE